MMEDGFLDLMKEEHLDILIRLAFELDSARIIEQLEKETEQAFSDKEEQITQQAMTSAYEKLHQQELNVTKNRRADRRHQRLMRAIEIVACVVLVIGISAPVAVASIETLRMRIVEFLISFNSEEESADVDPYDDIVIPDNWKGEYYPTFLPDEIIAKEVDPNITTKITYYLEDDQMIVFSENNDEVHVAMGVENESPSIMEINGYEAQVWEFNKEEYYTRIIWSIDERWFMLETRNLDLDGAYSIAESVRKITD